MQIPPDFTITPEILSLVAKIDALRIYFSSLKLPVNIKNKIQRVSYLKSSLFSARIEGNPLQLNEWETGEEKHKAEVRNILAAIKFIESLKADLPIKNQFLVDLHQRVMGSRVGFRHEMSAIYNQAGQVIYLPPPPTQIADMLARLLDHLNGTINFPLLTALITHLVFEKIHPFLDGNGRVGRLLIAAVLKTKNYDFGLVIPFEEYIDEHKEEYYHYLDVGMKETEKYLLFMLGAVLAQAEKIKREVEAQSREQAQIYLPPRQEEIYNIIKEHRVASFDFLKRRFLKLPARTLHYDLKKLIEKKLVIKIGRTKGVYYQINKMI